MDSLSSFERDLRELAGEGAFTEAIEEHSAAAGAADMQVAAGADDMQVAGKQIVGWPAGAEQNVAAGAAEVQMAAADAELEQMSGDMNEKAIYNYCKHHVLCVNDVSLQTVKDSTEGLAHWAFDGIECGASSTLRRQMNRQLERPEHRATQSMVKHLPPAMLKKFTQGWALSGKKSFDFVTDSKERVNYVDNQHEKERVFLTVGKIAQELGDERDPEVQEKAWRWACGAWNAHTDEDEWVRYSEWLEEYRYGFEIDKDKDLVGEKSLLSKQYKDVEDTNPWRKAAKEYKACLNFAQHFGMKVGKVALEDVKASKQGLDGWADIGDPVLGGKTPAASEKLPRVPVRQPPKPPKVSKVESASSSVNRRGAIGGGGKGGAAGKGTAKGSSSKEGWNPAAMADILKSFKTTSSTSTRSQRRRAC
jgi:hypothetical protein